ncbi:triose-phosphate isomerase [Candidatus Peregrinibacteria bacterium HGW-Peregrinibacteria-1]|nr:MAG: triose-phosphate isomerase [Candidatus Peregrinibacteria bacterium HGW-Peregrinibacteria-1]
MFKVINVSDHFIILSDFYQTGGFMELPTIIVNFKLYEQGTGDAALEMAILHEKIAAEMGVSIAIVVNFLDLEAIARRVKIPVFAQGMDPVGYGSHTGSISADMLFEKGAYGVLLNHAERPLEYVMLGECVSRARDAGLFTVVCVDSPEQGEVVKKYNPDMIAVEPPGLIGGDLSVAEADPAMIEKAVSELGRGNVIVGAGIRNGSDVRTSLALGASGVLLASGVVRADDPEMVLRDLAEALKRY